MQKRRAIPLNLIILATLFSCHLHAQILQTEDAIPLDPKQIHIETSGGFQTEADSKEYNWYAEVEYRLSKRFMLLVEPALISSIHPDSGTSATGFGDIETILFVRLTQEKKVLPFMSLAMEMKIPTAQNPMIGTGKLDFSPFFVANKTTGKFFTSINLGYTFIGKPDSVLANNFFNYGIASIFTFAHESLLFAEVYGNTASVDPDRYPEIVLPHSTIQENSEFGEGEIVFSLGYGYEFQNGWLLSGSVSYSNTNALLLRAGIQWESAKKKLKNVVTHIEKTVEKK